MEFIFDGMDDISQIEFHYISSAIPINGGSKEEEAYGNTNDNVVIESIDYNREIENPHYNQHATEEMVVDQSTAEEIVVDQPAADEIRVESSNTQVLRKKKISHDKKGLVVCEGHCGKVFSSKLNMNRHLDSHKNIITCRHCGFEVRGDRNHRKHMINSQP